MNQSDLDELVLAGVRNSCAVIFAQGKIVASDKRFLDIFKYSEGQVESLQMADLFAQAADVERVKAALAAKNKLDPLGAFISVSELIVLPDGSNMNLSGGEALRREGWLKRCDGELFYGSVEFNWRAQGEMSLLVRDLTESRTQSDAYKLLRQRFSAVFDQTYQFTGLLDAEGTLLEVNQTALKFAGHTTDEVIGKPFWEARWWAVSPVVQEKLKAAIEEARKGNLVRDTVQNIGADGEVVSLDFSIKPVKDDEGNVIMLIPEGRDITERVVAELELKAKTRELEEANRLLRESERLKSEFFANVSHELRTPLTLLLAPLDTLISGAAGEISPPQMPLLQVAHNNAARLLQMINGLLDFSKLEAQKVQVNREPTEVCGLVRSLVSDFEPVLKSHKLTMDLNFDEEPLLVEIDRYLFERILFNLLSNAVKFTGDGGGIKVALSHQGGVLSVQVKDSGIGIAEEDLPNLFQKFRQLEGSSVRRFEGTGLGLALVKEFSELLGGSIKVQSSPGQGSTFTVQLNAPPVESTEIASFAVAAAKVQSAEALRRMPVMAVEQDVHFDTDYADASLPTILVAEDNPELAQYIKFLLKDVCRVIHVADGLSALARLEECGDSLSLILSDVMMPRLDGLEFARKVKADDRFNGIPLILLSALTHRDAMLQGWHAGADDYLFKPFHPVELVARVRAALRNYKVVKSLNQELVKSRDEAVKAYKFKSDFLSHMSHEIRTPMNAVIGMSDLLARTQLDDSQVKMLADIQYSADVLLELLNDILDYSKVESGNVEIETISFDLKGLVEGCAMLLAGRSTQKGLSLTTSFDVTVPPVVKGDPVRIRQVLLNLLSNAVKFTDRGAVSVATAVDARDSSRVILRFTVSDTGIGMSEETIANLFQPFVQGDSSITRRFGGTGLGLAICRGLVERMGGRIGVAGEPGRGSTFWFTVPLAMGANDSVKMPGEGAHTYAASRHADLLISKSEALGGETKPKILHRSERILVAEDNQMNQTLLVLQLREFGFEARAVSNGAEAVEAYASGDYDAVFMDCQMPGLDGMAASQAIRDLEESRRKNGVNVRRVPIIAVTAHAMPSDRERCRESGMDDFLPKPITQKDLREVVDRWLPKVEVK